MKIRGFGGCLTFSHVNYQESTHRFKGLKKNLECLKLEFLS